MSHTQQLKPALISSIYGYYIRRIVRRTDCIAVRLISLQNDVIKPTIASW